MTIEIDHTAMRQVIAGLRGAGTSLDGAGRSLPGTAGCGDATVLLEDILFAFTDTATKLVVEGATLSDLAEQCNVDYQSVDSNAAEQALALVKKTP